MAETESGYLRLYEKLKEDTTKPDKPLILDKDSELIPRILSEFSFDFSTSCDKENQPAGIPRAGVLSVKVKAARNDVIIEGEGDDEEVTVTEVKKAEIFDWWMRKTKLHGKIEILLDTVKSAGKATNIEFYNAYCVSYKQSGKMPGKDDSDEDKKAGLFLRTEEIKIAWKKMVWEGVTYEHDWN
jgi:hypothetical protein